MRIDKLTTKFQQALADAQSLALGHDAGFIEPQHLLAAMLAQEDGYTALKLYPLAQPIAANPHGMIRHVSQRSIDRAAVELAVARVRAVREPIRRPPSDRPGPRC